MKYLIYFIFIIFIFTSCKHQKANSRRDLLDSIIIEEFACEGDCPVYILTIYSNGKANFNGKLNVIREGKLTFQFSKDETKKLFEYLSTINFLDFQNEYKSLIADLPETVISYKEKRIAIKDLRTVPKELRDLANKLKLLARSTGYIN